MRGTNRAHRPVLCVGLAITRDDVRERHYQTAADPLVPHVACAHATAPRGAGTFAARRRGRHRAGGFPAPAALRADRARDPPQAYLFKIAANVLAERSARASWRQPHASEWLAQLTDARDPEQECAREEEHSEVRNAVAALPPRARTILRMHYEENLTYETIAQRLNITRRIVKRDLIRAYADLRAAIRMEDR